MILPLDMPDDLTPEQERAIRQYAFNIVKAAENRKLIPPTSQVEAKDARLALLHTALNLDKVEVPESEKEINDG